MSFGEGDLHAKVAQLKTENGRLESENRELRALVRDAWAFSYAPMPYMPDEIAARFDAKDDLIARMADLGIEVEP